MSKRALGRGIDALLAGQTGDRAAITSVPVSSIKVSGHQPRRSFSEEALMELAQSIRSKGVLQPILVEPSGSDEYSIVAGERRYRAAKLAGVREIPVLIRSFSELERTEIALIENLQREDLSPVEEALGYKTLMDAGKLTQEEVAQRVGKNRSTVANSLRLLKLSETILEALDRGRISAGHARALLAAGDGDARKRLFRRILDQELSVRQAEREAAGVQAKAGDRAGDRGRSRGITKSAELSFLQERLIERLGTKVNIRGSHTRGRVEISYFSMEDLERISSLIFGER